MTIFMLVVVLAAGAVFNHVHGDNEVHWEDIYTECDTDASYLAKDD